MDYFLIKKNFISYTYLGYYIRLSSVVLRPFGLAYSSILLLKIVIYQTLFFLLLYSWCVSRYAVPESRRGIPRATSSLRGASQI